MVEHGGKASGLRLDWCLTWGRDCGKPAARLFCKKQKYSAAVQIGKDKDIGHTKLLKTGQVCKDPNCLHGHRGYARLLQGARQNPSRESDLDPAATNEEIPGREIAAPRGGGRHSFGRTAVRLKPSVSPWETLVGHQCFPADTC